MSKSSLACIAMILVISIYTCNSVSIRYSMTHGLSEFDLTMIRYVSASFILWPIFLYIKLKKSTNKLRSISFAKTILLTCLSGSPYIFLFYIGLSYAPASHGSVFNHAVVPAVVFIGMAWLGKEKMSTQKIIGLIGIMVGVSMVASLSLSVDFQVFKGDIIIFITGLSWGVFTILCKRWHLDALQTAFNVSLISLIFVPFYFLFFYQGLGEVSWMHIILQAFNQGFLNTVLALVLIVYAIQNLDAETVALFFPITPISTTLLAMFILEEVPSMSQWIGIMIVAFSMYILMKRSKTKLVKAPSS